MILMPHKPLSSSIDDPNERATAQLEVVRKIVVRDIPLATVAASKIVRPYFRAYAYMEIANKDPQFPAKRYLGSNE